MKKEYTYEVTENGYYILINGEKVIHQYEPYILNKELSYEENAKAQIKEMKQADENTVQEKIEIEQLKEQITDLQLALAEIVEGGM